MPRQSGDDVRGRNLNKKGYIVDETETLSRLKAALTAVPCRIELGTAYNLSGGQPSSYPTAHIYEKVGTRWVKAGPYIAPPEGEDRAGLLDVLAALVRDAAHETARETEHAEAEAVTV